MGGLGHLAIQIAAAFGAEVTVFSTSDAKKQEALSFGAKHFIVSKDEKAMAAAAGTLDGILDTAAVKKDIAGYLSLLAPHGVLVAIGGVTEPYHDVAPVHLLWSKCSLRCDCWGTCVGCQGTLALECDSTCRCCGLLQKI
jgi:D-arabinose 1-dehydrogenase-like Zn-dependent alcohol dehydrogenase